MAEGSSEAEHVSKKLPKQRSIVERLVRTISKRLCFSTTSVADAGVRGGGARAGTAESQKSLHAAKLDAQEQPHGQPGLLRDGGQEQIAAVQSAPGQPGKQAERDSMESVLSDSNPPNCNSKSTSAGGAGSSSRPRRISADSSISMISAVTTSQQVQGSYFSFGTDFGGRDTAPDRMLLASTSSSVLLTPRTDTESEEYKRAYSSRLNLVSFSDGRASPVAAESRRRQTEGSFPMSRRTGTLPSARNSPRLPATEEDIPMPATEHDDGKLTAATLGSENERAGSSALRTSEVAAVAAAAAAAAGGSEFEGAGGRSSYVTAWLDRNQSIDSEATLSPRPILNAGDGGGTSSSMWPAAVAANAAAFSLPTASAAATVATTGREVADGGCSCASSFTLGGGGLQSQKSVSASNILDVLALPTVVQGSTAHPVFSHSLSSEDLQSEQWAAVQAAEAAAAMGPPTAYATADTTSTAGLRSRSRSPMHTESSQEMRTDDKVAAGAATAGGVADAGASTADVSGDAATATADGSSETEAAAALLVSASDNTHPDGSSTGLMPSADTLALPATATETASSGKDSRRHPVVAAAADLDAGAPSRHAQEPASSSKPAVALVAPSPQPPAVPIVHKTSRHSNNTYDDLAYRSAAETHADGKREATKTIAVAHHCPEDLLTQQWDINDFVLMRKMYEGGVSVVAQAVHKRSGRMVALKIYKRSRLGEMERFQLAREICLHVRTLHPYVVSLYAAWKDSRYVYLVMEWASKGNLFDYLVSKKGRLTEEEAAQKVLKPLLSALAHMHSMEYIHRDIKLENILMDGDYKIKLADFGLAIDRRHELANTRLGTFGYFAPEVLDCPLKRTPFDYKDRPDLSYDCKVDVWSSGVVAYELLTGKAPFSASTAPKILQAIRTRVIPFPDHLSAMARDFVSAMLTRDPQQRLSAKELLLHPWLLACCPKTPRASFNEGSLMGRLSSSRMLSPRSPRNTIIRSNSVEL